MKKAFFSLLAVVLVAGAVIVWAGPVHAQTFVLETTHGFVQLLIDKGIIPEALAGKARELASMIEALEGHATTSPATTNSATASSTPQGPLNADKVDVSVSQLIENGSLTYNHLEDVKGLLLLVKNTTDQDITLEAKRHCQVVYRIYDANDKLVYDSSTSNQCQTNERVTYLLPAGETRMFGVDHPESVHALQPGVYRFELEYPGYGKGDLSVTIQ